MARRITCYFDPRRRMITLTTFRKQRQREQREVTRARRAMKAGFKVGLVTHRPIGGERAYLMYYMRPADFRRWKLGR